MWKGSVRGIALSAPCPNSVSFFFFFFLKFAGCLRAAEEDVVGGAKTDFSWREGAVLAGAPQYPCVPQPAELPLHESEDLCACSPGQHPAGRPVS